MAEDEQHVQRSSQQKGALVLWLAHLLQLHRTCDHPLLQALVLSTWGKSWSCAEELVGLYHVLVEVSEEAAEDAPPLFAACRAANVQQGSPAALALCFVALCRSLNITARLDGDEDVIPFRGSGGQVHALIVALDYSYSPGHELSCTKDAQAMLRMLQRAGVQDVNVMTDHHLGMPGFPTRDEVLRGLKTVARRGQPGDWFFWFFAGHGVNVPDSQGEEADGQDEAFVTPSDMGKLSQKSLLIDDTFAEALDRCVPEGVRILCVCDCCHSGSICDIDSYRYRHEIYQIAASQDDQVAEDTGQGGLLTQALRRTILVESIRHRDDEFSIQNVVDLVLRHAHRMSRSQDISFQYSGTDPRRVAWPMCFPWTEYLHLANDNIEAYELDLDVENP